MQLIGLLLISFLSVVSLLQPVRGPLGEGPTEFSVERAFAQLEKVASEPHAVGTEALGQVRQYLINELESMGANLELQEAVARDVALTNLIVRVPGSLPTGTVLLVAHYDSRPGSPGAADDGSGTVVLLETLRAVLASPQLPGDLVFLFTDGEELGLLGAEVFASSHPLMDDVELVLNFEAIGNAGPSVLFETGSENGWLLREYARACPQPVGSSLGKVVYDQMPNDTDFSCFRDRGVPGLNFALCLGSTAYHQPWDHPDNLSKASLAHQGASALSLARHFGSLDCRDRAESDAVFFSLPAGPLIQWPYSWSLPMALVLLVLTLWRLATVFRRERWKLVELFGSVLRTGGSVLVACGLAIGAWHAIELVAGVSELVLEELPEVGNLTSGTLTYLGLVFAAWSGLAICAGAFSPRSLDSSVWIVRILAAILAVVLAWKLPGASYAVLLPLAGAHLMPTRTTERAALLNLLGSLPTLLLCLPVGYLVFMIASRALAPSIWITASVLALTGTLLLPQLAQIGQKAGRKLTITGIVTMVLLFAGAVARVLGF